jgi:hypothetical protein
MPYKIRIESNFLIKKIKLNNIVKYEKENNKNKKKVQKR